MAGRLVRVFSSAADLEELGDEPFVVERAEFTERRHLLDAGADYFDAAERPIRPPPQTLKKAFSGSMLDLDDAAEPVPKKEGAGNNNNDDDDDDREDDQQIQEESRGVVAVMGGNQFLNGHIVSFLLDRGYTAAVFLPDLRGSNKSNASEYLAIAGSKNGGGSSNSLSEEQRAKQLTDFSGKSSFASAPLTSSSNSNGNNGGVALNPRVNYTSRLILEDCDINDSSALKDSLKRCNCRFIIHGGVNAAPTLTAQKTLELHTTCVRALFEAVRSLRSGTIARIIVTSSTSAIASGNDPCPLPAGFTEDSFNRSSTATKEPSIFAKAHFEAEVWRLAKGSNVDVSVIIPAIMLGPSRTSESSDAMRLVCDFARSSSYFPFAPNMYWNFVDVRDVALMHVVALDSTAARNRRYIASSSNLNLAEIGQLIRKANRNLKAPIYSMPTGLALFGPLFGGSRVRLSYLWKNLGVRRPLSNARAVSELGITFRSMESTVRDSIADLTEQGMLPEASGAVDADWETARGVLIGSAVVGAIGATWYLKYYRNNNKK